MSYLVKRCQVDESKSVPIWTPNEWISGNKHEKWIAWRTRISACMEYLHAFGLDFW